MRNFLVTLFCSQGVPMLLAGDEIGRTQRGNNNAYCQDNEMSWIDWEAAGKQQDLIDFTCALSELRRRAPGVPPPPVLQRPGRVPAAPGHGGLQDIVWLTPAGQQMTDGDWQTGYARSLAVFLNGDAITEPGPRGETVSATTASCCCSTPTASRSRSPCRAPGSGPVGGADQHGNRRGRRRPRHRRDDRRAAGMEHRSGRALDHGAARDRGRPG